MSRPAAPIDLLGNENFKCDRNGNVILEGNSTQAGNVFLVTKQ